MKYFCSFLIISGIFFRMNVLGQRSRNDGNSCPVNCFSTCDERSGDCVCVERKFGSCVRCQPGYYGSKCDVRCPKERYGQNCGNPCKCQNGGTCDSITGECSCHPNFAGKNCEIIYMKHSELNQTVREHWQDYLFGCENKCKNDGLCDPVSKACICSPGFIGKNCESACTNGFFGKNCKSQCKCKNGANCNHITGFCDCLDSNFGRFCEHSKQEILKNVKDIFLADLLSGCNNTCSHNGICNLETSTCKCFPGFQGKFCDSACKNGFYGDKCSKECLCENDGICDHITGKCVCSENWIGDNCSLSLVDMEDRLIQKKTFYYAAIGVGSIILLLCLFVFSICCCVVCKKKSVVTKPPKRARSGYQVNVEVRDLPQIPQQNQSHGGSFQNFDPNGIPLENAAGFASVDSGVQSDAIYATLKYKDPVRRPQADEELYSNCSITNSSLNNIAFQSNPVYGNSSNGSTYDAIGQYST